MAKSPKPSAAAKPTAAKRRVAPKKTAAVKTKPAGKKAKPAARSAAAGTKLSITARIVVEPMMPKDLKFNGKKVVLGVRVKKTKMLELAARQTAARQVWELPLVCVSEPSRTTDAKRCGDQLLRRRVHIWLAHFLICCWRCVTKLPPGRFQDGYVALMSKMAKAVGTTM